MCDSADLFRPLDRGSDEEEPASANAGLEERVLTASAKVVDFGNACWTHKQFTSDIQTRQYRCPEVRPFDSNTKQHT